MTTATKTSPTPRTNPASGDGFCPECGAPATYDLAPNPGPGGDGGPHAPPIPPPNGVTLPPAELPPDVYPYRLVVCSTGAHNTLWPEYRVPELTSPPPGKTAEDEEEAERKAEELHESQEQAYGKAPWWDGYKKAVAEREKEAKEYAKEYGKAQPKAHPAEAAKK